MSDAAPILECRRIGKRFGGAIALDGVDFDLRPGESHGLCGSNGAGKSTLMKILAGALTSYEGEIRIDGRTVELTDPAAAQAAGIAMVYQELSGIGQLSVAENLCLGRQPVSRLGTIHWRKMEHQAREFLKEMAIDIDVRERLDRFPLVIRQMVEIARGVHSGARILILDEPTSALSPPETRRLLTLIRELKSRGVAMVFISHFLEDVLEICDRVTILKDGRLVQTSPAGELDKHTIIHRMLGHGLEGAEVGYETGVTLPARSQRPIRLVAENLSLAGRFANVSLQVAEGECVGLYGFVGAGHQELAHALAAAIKTDAGTITVDGKPLSNGDTAAAVRRGVVLVAADRAQTLVRSTEIYKNITLAHLKQTIGSLVTRGRELAVASPLLQTVGCRPRNPLLKAGQLSGGNQQKVVFAKWLLGPIRCLVLEEPTRGMDVGAKDEVMKLVAGQKQAGAAVVLASTEPELLLAHCDRILLFRRGVLTREFAGEPVDRTALMQNA
jgi:ribose transport system ATP-binding protein